MIRYLLYAALLGLAVSVCAESVLHKDIGLLTREEIEENLQVCPPSTMPNACRPLYSL